MKILVPIKRVVDYRVKIRVKTDGSGVVTEHVKMSMNPFDEIAIEEALRLKEKQIAKEIIVVCIGDAACQETLRAALAMGAEKAMLIETSDTLLPRAIATILQSVIETEKPQLVLMGKQAIDNDYNQTGQILAARMHWPIATFASKITITGDTAEVTREVDAGLETIQFRLPGIITTDLRLNQPRLASLPNIMQAKQKPLSVKSLADFSLQLDGHCQTLHVAPPPVRQAGVILDNVETLVRELKQRKVIE